jgi:hypothetical protein
MFKFFLIGLASCAVAGCGYNMAHGKIVKQSELDSARFARRDLCCAQTMNKISDTKYEAFGCGQAATYELIDKKWQRVGPIRAGSGDPADKLKDCNQ